MMLTLSKNEPLTTPPLAPGSGVELVHVAPARWRVLDASGRAIGHLDAESTPVGTRFRARRYHPPTRSLRELGAFWSSADAVECLRLSR